MRCVTEHLRSLSWFRLALVAAITVGTAGCSTDFSRLSDSGSSPSGGRPSSELTGAVQPKPTTGPINSNALPPPVSQPAPLSSNLPAPSSSSTAPEPRFAVQSSPKPPINNAAPPATNTLPMHVVTSGDTLHKIARQHRISVTDLTSANKLAPNAKLKLGDRLAIPPSREAQQPVSPPQPKVIASPKPTNPPTSTIRKIGPTPDVATENKELAGGATLSFRWPVRGRVIAGFGPKPSGQENHGINFAVPEGTPIKAAEDGVVAYASNELKTYGNLVLIRHANGFVTAYAHASEILVKRDEVVKRGQVIAKSGQTGNVSAPQLHFEIRKGAVPVDPMPYLDRSPQA